MYKTFTNSDKKRKTNCDYCMLLPNGKKLYVEIAGVIPNDTADWRHYEYKYKHHQEYQQKMLYKEKILIEDRKSTRLNSSHMPKSRMPSSA